MKSKKKLYLLSIFTIMFLIFLRIDYRDKVPQSFNSGDDANYYFHNKTISYDFDFDYSNQISTTNDMYLNQEKNDYVPIHPVGSAFLTFIFMLFGKYIERYLSIQDFHYFLYSLSGIYFLFLSLKLLSISNFRNRVENKITVAIFFLGSGLLYFSFERFSMTHVYEVFSVILLFYLSYLLILGIKYNKFIIFLLGFLSIFLVNIRFVNIFLPLTPFFYLLLNDEKNITKNLLKNLFYYVGLLTGLTVNLIITKALYGFYTLTPIKIYDSSGGVLANFYNLNIENKNILEIINFLFQSFLKILIGFEFGIFFISPVIFFSLFTFLKILKSKEYMLLAITLFIFAIPFGIVIIWQTTASSFGFRYLYVLIPYSILLIFTFYKNKIVLKIIFILSVFSFLLYLFFESTDQTSLREGINIFGKYHRYSSPNFIPEAVKSFFILNSYLKIIFTSFFGVIILKFGILIFSIEKIETLIEYYGYLNEDVIELINFTNSITFIHFLSIIVLIIISFRLFYSSTINESHAENYL